MRKMATKFASSQLPEDVIRLRKACSCICWLLTSEFCIPG